MKPAILTSLMIVVASVFPASGADLLDRVRDDAGMCIVVDDFPAHAEKLENSPLRRRIEALPVFQSWLETDDVSKIKETVAQLEAVLGGSLIDSATNLIGEQALIAVYPREDGGPAGLLLTSPTKMKDAERLLDLWHVIENAEVTVQPAGYWKRVTHRATVYYLLKEGLFAVSDRESLIRQLAENSSPVLEKPLTKTEAWSKPMSQVQERSWIRVWFRPELWGGVVKLPHVDGPQGVMLKQLKTSASIVLEVDTENGVHAGLHLHHKPGQQPEVLSRFRRDSPEGTGLLETVSDETVAVVSGRGGFGFAGMFLDRMTSTQGDRDQRYLRTLLKGLLFGKDPYTEVLPAIGRQWSVEVRRSDSQSEIPVSVLFNASLEDDAKSGISLQKSLDNLMASAIRFLAISEGFSEDDVTTESLPGGTTLSHYSSKRGLQPSFMVAPFNLFIASDEDRLRRAVLEQSKSVSSNGPFSILANRDLAHSQSGMFLNFTAAREVLQGQSEKVLDLLGIPEQRRSNAEESLRLTAESLQLLDGVYATWLCREESWSLFLGAVVQAD